MRYPEIGIYLSSMWHISSHAVAYAISDEYRYTSQEPLHHPFERIEGISKDTSAELLSQMKDFMINCYRTEPEEYCLKTVFNSGFFWN